MAGLDPVGRRLILDIIRSRQARRETTIVISHDLKDIMTLADKIAILDKGSLVFFGNLKELLEKRELLACCRFEWPEHLQLVFALAERGFKVETNVTSLTEAGLELLKSLA
jgi:energy-coupling factor transport system ATP-binding protein